MSHSVTRWHTPCACINCSKDRSRHAGFPAPVLRGDALQSTDQLTAPPACGPRCGRDRCIRPLIYQSLLIDDIMNHNMMQRCSAGHWRAVILCPEIEAHMLPDVFEGMGGHPSWRCPALQPAVASALFAHIPVVGLPQGAGSKALLSVALVAVLSAQAACSPSFTLCALAANRWWCSDALATRFSCATSATR